MVARSAKTKIIFFGKKFISFNIQVPFCHPKFSLVSFVFYNWLAYSTAAIAAQGGCFEPWTSSEKERSTCNTTRSTTMDTGWLATLLSSSLDWLTISTGFQLGYLFSICSIAIESEKKKLIYSNLHLHLEYRKSKMFQILTEQV